MNRIWFVLTILWIAGCGADRSLVDSAEPDAKKTSQTSFVESSSDGQTGSSVAAAEATPGNQDPAAEPKKELIKENQDKKQGDAPKQVPGKTGEASDDKADLKEPDPADVEMEKLMAKYQPANAKLAEQVQKADPKDQMRLWINGNPLNEMAPEFMALVNKYPQSTAALKSITVLLAQGTGDIKENAVKVLIDRYLDDERILRVINSVSVGLPSPHTETWLQEIATKSPNKKIQAKAIQTHIDYIRSVKQVRDFSKTNPDFVDRAGEATISYLKSYDFEKAENDKFQLLTRLSKDYSDVPSEIRGKTYGNIADRELFVINNLSVGKTPPEIEGEDLEQQQFKLSDYRGKVVLLVFWGDWCRPCKAMYPQKRSFVKKLADKPFALIGVNSDKDRDAIRGIMKDKQLDWRNFWNGSNGTQGPISNAWNVNAWPTTYVLDANGVIRYKNVRDKELDAALAKLLAEMGHEVDLSDHSDGQLPEKAPGTLVPGAPGSAPGSKPGSAPGAGVLKIEPSKNETPDKDSPKNADKNNGNSNKPKDDDSK